MASSQRELRVRSRSGTYLVVTGVVIGMIATGLGVPFLFGTPMRKNVQTNASTFADNSANGPTPAVADGPPVGGAAPGVTGAGASGPAAGGTSSAGSQPESGSGSAVGAAPSAPQGAAGAPAPAPTGGGGGGGAPAGTVLTASDRGVTPTSIKLGVTIIDLGGAGKLGFGIPGFDPKLQESYYNAFIGNVNKNGGLLGRKIDPVYITYDPTNSDSMQAACLQATQDAKVFAVVDGGGLNGPAELCTGGAVGTPEGLDTQAHGNLFTLFESGMRSLSNLSWFAAQRGYLKGHTIGILDDENPGNPQTVTDSAVRVLAQLGYKIGYRVDLSADAGTANSQIPVAVQQMRGHGVDLIFLATNLISTTTFVQAAAGSGYTPDYLATDWQSQTADLAVTNMPDSFRAKAISSIRIGEWRTGAKPDAAEIECHDIYRAGSGTDVPQSDDNYQGMNFACGLIKVLTTGATRAGVNLTRSGLSKAIQAIGPLPLAFFGSASYRAGKFDAADGLRTLTFQNGCKCWVPTDAFVAPHF
jgi:hypothetical protein